MKTKAYGCVRIKRVYEALDSADGYRVLIDGLWPRGLRKEKAAVDIWLRGIAPSTELRQWFGHDPQRFQEFARRYRAELGDKSQVLTQLHQLTQEHKPLTLLYAARDEQHNNAVVLRDVLNETHSE